MPAKKFDDDAINFLEEDDELEFDLNESDPDEDEDEEDDELEEYSQKVQKRVHKKSDDDDDDDSKPLIKKLLAENEELRKKAEANSKAAVSTAKEALTLKIKKTEETFRDAYESGDSDALLKASQELADLRFEMKATEYAEKSQPRQQERVVDHKAEAWAERNKEWFGKDAKMTALAYGIHEELVTKGVDPRSDEYYEQLDSELRSVFPDKLGRGTKRESTPKKAAPVVAPVQRSSGSNPKKVRLTANQIRLAKRLGLTPQQYAKQAVKDGVFSD